MRFGQIGIPEALVVLFFLAMVLVVIWPASAICRRLGFSPWLGVVAVVPVLNLVLLWFIALAPWPLRDTGPRSV